MHMPVMNLEFIGPVLQSTEKSQHRPAKFCRTGPQAADHEATGIHWVSFSIDREISASVAAGQVLPAPNHRQPIMREPELEHNLLICMHL
jgi:hypothetical protein